MKKSILIISLIVVHCSIVYSQDPTIKAARLKDLTGKQVIATTFDNAGKPYIVFFWATGNAVSKEMLNSIVDQYASWQKETGVKIITVAVDNVQNSMRVGSYIQSNGWVYENYIDQDQDYMHDMNVKEVPYVFVFNGHKEITFQLSYSINDKQAIFDAVRKTLE